MTLIEFIVAIEILVGVALLVWLIRKAHRHAKTSPAERALQLHLQELQAAKEAADAKSPDKKAAATKKASKK